MLEHVYKKVNLKFQIKHIFKNLRYSKLDVILVERSRAKGKKKYM